jgi:hypothetical protein
VNKLVKRKNLIWLPLAICIIFLGVFASATKLLAIYLVCICLLGFIIGITKINDFPLYVSVALYALLPQYFAIEISSSLPLITASRIIILFLLFYAIIKGKLKRNVFYIIIHSGYSKILIGYFTLSLIATLPYLNNGSILKDLFGIIFDQILLFILITNSVDSKKKLDKCIWILTISFIIVCICGIVERFTGYNFWNNFYTISRSITNANDTRLGVNRVSFSFSHPIYFGMYIVLLIPIIMYMIKSKKNNNIYIIGLALGIICCFFTVSRGPIGVMFLTIILNFFDMKRQERKRFISFFIMIGILIFIGLLFFSNMVDSIIITLKTILNEFGFSYNVDDFGSNSGGVDSRLSQFDIYGNAIRNNWLFGIGSGASDIYVSVDNAYLGWILSGGVFGLASKLTLYLGSIVLLFNQRNSTPICKAVFYSMLCYMVASLAAPENITTKMVWILLGLAAVSRVIEKDEQDNALKRMKNA